MTTTGSVPEKISATAGTAEEVDHGTSPAHHEVFTTTANQHRQILASAKAQKLVGAYQYVQPLELFGNSEKV